MQPDDTPPNQPAAEPAGAAETLASEVSRPGADSEEAPASLLDAALKALGSEVEGGRAEEVQDQPAQRETEPGHADAVVSSPVGQA
ncbi:MAG: hypothetical protein N2036_12635, partial [Bryobacteraceae bacterium]|nr:hypothetical protein [Bryobacteraceae bacterium]